MFQVKFWKCANPLDDPEEWIWDLKDTIPANDWMEADCYRDMARRGKYGAWPYRIEIVRM